MMKKITAFLLSMIIILSLSACGMYEEIDWTTLSLSNVLPEPSVTKGRIISDSNTSLSVEFKCDSIDVYDEYVENCKSKGFTVDAEESEDLYKAYNSEGYKLSVDYSDILSTLDIDLDTPLETSEISFDNSQLAALIPTPESNIGKISYDSSDLFSVYVANTPIETYKTYVDSCYNAGFNIDYDRGDDYYYADNADGYSLSVRYQGFNIMYISVEAPEDTTTEEEQISKTEKVTESKTDTVEQTENENVVDTSVSYDEIYKAYKENELRADETYKNNRYRITAEINGMKTGGLMNLTGGATLTMEKQVDDTIVFFYAEFEKDQEDALKNVSVGDTITFEGECLSAGSWDDCEIVE